MFIYIYIYIRFFDIYNLCMQALGTVRSYPIFMDSLSRCDLCILFCSLLMQILVVSVKLTLVNVVDVFGSLISVCLCVLF